MVLEIAIYLKSPIVFSKIKAAIAAALIEKGVLTETLECPASFLDVLTLWTYKAGSCSDGLCVVDVRYRGNGEY